MEVIAWSVEGSSAYIRVTDRIYWMLSECEGYLSRAVMAQYSVPVLMAMQMPRMTGHMVIKANQGEGESLREEETTTEEDGEREVSEPSKPSKAPATPRGKVTRVKAQRSPSK